MKKIIFKSILILILAFGALSCKNFLDLQPLNVVPAATYYTNNATIQSGLAACVIPETDGSGVWFVKRPRVRLPAHPPWKG